MSVAETLANIANTIQSPTVQSVESLVNAVAAAVPGGAAVAAGLQAAETVAGSVAAAVHPVAGAPLAAPVVAPAPVAPVLSPIPVPPAPTTAAESVPALPAGTDAASVAAAGVASNPNSDPVISRVEAIEQAILSFLPIIGSIAKEMGL